jgi:hypothetical protein
MTFLSNRIHIYYNVCVFEDSSVNEDVVELQSYRPGFNTVCAVNFTEINP